MKNLNLSPDAKEGENELAETGKEDIIANSSGSKSDNENGYTSQECAKEEEED